MEDTTREIASRLAAASSAAGIEWEGYGAPSTDDFIVVIDSMIEHLEQFEGPVAMELPSTNVKLDRNEDERYNVYLKVGEITEES